MMTTIANAFFKVLEFFDRRKWAVLVLGIVLGIVFVLVFQALFVTVEYVNTQPGSLRADFKNSYLLWIARNYESQSLADPEWARLRLLGLGYNNPERKATIERDVKQTSAALEELAQACVSGKADYVTCDANDAVRLRNLSADVKSIPAQTTAPSIWESIWSIVRPICLILFVLLVVVGGGFILYRWWRGRQEDREVREAIAERARPAVPAAAWGVEGMPLAQFPTTYALGDDHFDPSFSIEMENGEFMGECGVGVSETIGVGTPNKITAFEVWLFDKSDIRTVTKVMMSEYAYGDEALRTKLAPKGEPVLANEGAEAILETKTLRVKARVVEAQYGLGNLPQHSFFERISIDLAAWVKAAPEEGEEFLEGSYELPGV
jgi:hypothetical protein